MITVMAPSNFCPIGTIGPIGISVGFPQSSVIDRLVGGRPGAFARVNRETGIHVER
jgi:hypothetical protein